MFKATIDSVEYLGKEILAKVVVDNVETFNIFLKNKENYKNEEIFFNFSSSKLHLLILKQERGYNEFVIQVAFKIVKNKHILSLESFISNKILKTILLLLPSILIILLFTLLPFIYAVKESVILNEDENNKSLVHFGFSAFSDVLEDPFFN